MLFTIRIEIKFMYVCLCMYLTWLYVVLNGDSENILFFCHYFRFHFHKSKGKKRGSVTYSTDRENEVRKIFIISLVCV